MRNVLAADQRPGPGLARGGGPFRLRGERIRARFGETSPEPWRRRAGPPYSTQVASRRQLNYGMVAPSFSPIFQRIRVWRSAHRTAVRFSNDVRP